MYEEFHDHYGRILRTYLGGALGPLLILVAKLEALAAVSSAGIWLAITACVPLLASALFAYLCMIEMNWRVAEGKLPPGHFDGDKNVELKIRGARFQSMIGWIVPLQLIGYPLAIIAISHLGFASV